MQRGRATHVRLQPCPVEFNSVQTNEIHPSLLFSRVPRASPACTRHAETTFIHIILWDAKSLDPARFCTRECAPRAGELFLTPFFSCGSTTSGGAIHVPRDEVLSNSAAKEYRSNNEFLIEQLCTLLHNTKVVNPPAQPLTTSRARAVPTACCPRSVQAGRLFLGCSSARARATLAAAARFVSCRISARVQN